LPPQTTWNAELALILKQFLFNAGFFVLLFFFISFLTVIKKNFKIKGLKKIGASFCLFFSSGLFAAFCFSGTAPFIAIPILAKAYHRVQSSKESELCSFKQNLPIVVLGGGVVAGGFLSPYSYRRVLSALEMLKNENYKFLNTLPKTIIFSGGVMPNTLVSEASVMKESLQLLLQKENIKFQFEFNEDNLSKNTFENAKFTKELLSKKTNSQGSRIFLITSLWHLPRAVKTFEKIGFSVCSFALNFKELNSNGFFSFDAAINTSLILNEYFGILGYKLKGWI
jgi:uncharacterized SAM-binding protein YcdF (DUF218 family)